MTTIRHALTLNASATAVRAAINTGAGVRGWWAKDATVGQGEGSYHELRFDKGGNTVVMKFRVDIDAPDKITWTCTDNANPVWPGTSLTWSLSADGDRTNVVFEHAGFTEADSAPYRMTADGWEHFIESLRAYTETGTGQPW